MKVKSKASKLLKKVAEKSTDAACFTIIYQPELPKSLQEKK